MNITVYLGSSLGNNPVYAQAVRELGTYIGSQGHRLIYGGSKSGLMGILADSVLSAGGKVTGVQISMFLKRDLQHRGISELIETGDLPERKTKMISLGDAFIAFPGGTGTLEEMAEVISRAVLGLLDGPVIFYNLNGYYEPMKAQFEQMKQAGFSDERRLGRISFCDSLKEIDALLQSAGCRTEEK